VLLALVNVKSNYLDFDLVNLMLVVQHFQNDLKMIQYHLNLNYFRKEIHQYQYFQL
jgi:hypothetical protein